RTDQPTPPAAGAAPAHWLATRHRTFASDLGCGSAVAVAAPHPPFELSSSNSRPTPRETASAAHAPWYTGALATTSAARSLRLSVASAGPSRNRSTPHQRPAARRPATLSPSASDVHVHWLYPCPDAKPRAAPAANAPRQLPRSMVLPPLCLPRRDVVPIPSPADTPPATHHNPTPQILHRTNGWPNGRPAFAARRPRSPAAPPWATGPRLSGSPGPFAQAVAVSANTPRRKPGRFQTAPAANPRNTTSSAATSTPAAASANARTGGKCGV